MNLKNKLQDTSLQKRFGLIFFLMAAIPLMAAGFLLWANNVKEKQRQQSIKQQYAQQSRATVIGYLRSIGTIAEMLEQSPDLIDYILAPYNLREYSENRLFARFDEASKDITPSVQWVLLDENANKILVTTNMASNLPVNNKPVANNPSNVNLVNNQDTNQTIITEKKENESKNKFDILKQDLSKENLSEEGLSYQSQMQQFRIVKKINYDDQQLQGPSAKLRGYLVGFVQVQGFTEVLGSKLIIDQDGPITDLNSLKMHLSDFINEPEISFPWISVFLIFIVIMGVFLGTFLVQIQVIKPIVAMTKDLMAPLFGVEIVKTANEIEFLKRAFEAYKEWMQKAQLQIEKKTRQSAMIDVAAQVAHDIRSPLSALNMLVVDLPQVPEERRVVIRSAVQRINDISNSLLQKSREKKMEEAKIRTSDMTLANLNQNQSEITHKENLNNEPILLTSLIDDLVSEKRIQFRAKIGITIDTDIDKAYGVFVKVNPAELKRALSNLINNSIEAFPNEIGKVLIAIKKNGDQAEIVITDNGKGIPSSVLSKLGEKGFSYGKDKSGDSGSGLGVFHAKNFIQSCGGKFSIHSTEMPASNHGTTIHFVLPIQPSPNWFVEKLKFSLGQNVFVVDDDQSIHGIWKGRLASANLVNSNFQGQPNNSKINLFNFTSANDFIQDYQNGKLPSKKENDIFLVDFEFLEQNINGLEVIQKLGIQKQSILVTSRYEEKRILQSCNNLGIPLIPKGMVGFIPFEKDF